MILNRLFSEPLFWFFVVLIVVFFLIPRRKSGSSRRSGYRDYGEYLQSPRWRQLRAQAKVRDGHRCRLCGRTRDLEVHHCQYPDQWGTEGVEDLTTLCADCHAMVSRRLNV